MSVVVNCSQRATGDVIYPVVAGIGSHVLVLGFGPYLLGRAFGLPGIFVAYAADEWVRGLLMMARWHWYGWLPNAPDGCIEDTCGTDERLVRVRVDLFFSWMSIARPMFPSRPNNAVTFPRFRLSAACNTVSLCAPARRAQPVGV